VVHCNFRVNSLWLPHFSRTFLQFCNQPLSLYFCWVLLMFKFLVADCWDIQEFPEEEEALGGSGFRLRGIPFQQQPWPREEKIPELHSPDAASNHQLPVGES
jgi:hypothetical protein